MNYITKQYRLLKTLLDARQLLNDMRNNKGNIIFGFDPTEVYSEALDEHYSKDNWNRQEVVALAKMAILNEAFLDDRIKEFCHLAIIKINKKIDEQMQKIQRAEKTKEVK